MANGVGSFFGGLARGTQAGITLNQNAQRINQAQQGIDIQKEKLEVERQTLAAQTKDAAVLKDIIVNAGLDPETVTPRQKNLIAVSHDMKVVGEVTKGIELANKDMQETDTLINQGKFLSTVDKSIRGPLVDQFAKSFKSRFEAELSEPVIATLKKGDPEMLNQLFTQIDTNVKGDPNANLQTVSEQLSNPQASRS